MHELSICQALLAQVEEVARAHEARAVLRIEVDVGPLAGVEPALLEEAFLVARLGRCTSAVLEITSTELIVACESCGARSPVPANRLLCAACDSHRTRLVAGDELRLRGVVLDVPAMPLSQTTANETEHVPGLRL